MQTRLLARETGHIQPQEFARSIASDLIRTFAPAPHHRFNGEALTSSSWQQPPLDPSRGGEGQSRAPPPVVEDRPHNIRAHSAGVSALTVDKFDGRVMLSGGADGSVKIWDLEDAPSPHALHTFQPMATIARSATTQDLSASVVSTTTTTAAAATRGGGHSHGITHIAFYPFDADAFLSSSFDKTLKLWSTTRASLSAEFHLNATVYSHATSPLADHLLVACATQHDHVRLVDLRSGAAVHALVSHGGPVLSAAWSPRREHVLASGHADGKVRLWDVRRAGGVIALLDQEDALGVVARAAAEHGRPPLFRVAARAHDEAVNAIQWTDDGHHLVTAGLDHRIRVWDADTGANTLASFGALIQNRHARTASLLLAPSGLLSRDHGGGVVDVLVWANDQEVLVFDMHDGNILTRLRSPGIATAPELGRINRSRITAMAWRGAGGTGRSLGPVMGGAQSVGTIYSAHLDGHIRAWMVAPPGPDDDEDGMLQDADSKREEEARLRKRKAVDDAYRSLMGKQITFT